MLPKNLCYLKNIIFKPSLVLAQSFYRNKGRKYIVQHTNDLLKKRITTIIY